MSQILKKGGTVIVPEYRTLSSDWEKARGLMFRMQAPEYAVYFPFSKQTKVGIHMFFVFFSLDIIWLDEDKKILDMKTMRPWTMYTPKKLAKHVFECPQGTISKYNLNIGDILSW